MQGYALIVSGLGFFADTALVDRDATAGQSYRGIIKDNTSFKKYEAFTYNSWDNNCCHFIDMELFQ